MIPNDPHIVHGKRHRQPAKGILWSCLSLVWTKLQQNKPSNLWIELQQKEPSIGTFYDHDSCDLQKNDMFGSLPALTTFEVVQPVWAPAAAEVTWCTICQTWEWWDTWVVSWFINPIHYTYKTYTYHKPWLLEVIGLINQLSYRWPHIVGMITWKSG